MKIDILGQLLRNAKYDDYQHSAAMNGNLANINVTVVLGFLPSNNTFHQDSIA
jgi:hypothetical protein